MKNSLSPSEIDDIADCLASRLNPQLSVTSSSTPVVQAPPVPAVNVTGPQCVPAAPPPVVPVNNPQPVPNVPRATAPPVKEIQLEKFQLGQYWDVYITTFHELATYNQWDTFTAA